MQLIELGQGQRPDRTFLCMDRVYKIENLDTHEISQLLSPILSVPTGFSSLQRFLVLYCIRIYWCILVILGV